MHAGHAVLLLLLTAGADPPGPDPPARGLPTAAMQPGTPQGGGQPATPDTSKPGAAAPSPSQAAPAPRGGGKEADAGAKGKPAALDLEALKQQLKDTRAIGFFSKITLKNQVDDLLDDFGDYYEGDKKLTIARLRRSYDLLVMKVLSLLQDEDPKLAAAIVSSREAIWDVLADPKKFATLKT